MDFVFFTKTSTVYSLLDVLLRLVVFLCEVLCRDLAGDLDEGQLFAVPGGVAGRLTHAEVVVSFHQEIWREDEQRPVVWWREGNDVHVCVCARESTCLRDWSESVPQRFKADIVKDMSHPELGQHTPCTVQGCSTERRLQEQNQPTLVCTWYSSPGITLVWFPTGHVHHAAVAVVHQVARFAVDAAGCDAVAVKEVGVHGRHFAVPPRWGEVYEL